MILFFTACEKEILTNDTPYGDNNATDLTSLSSDISSITLNIGASQTVEINSTKADGSDDSFSIISTSTVFDSTISYSSVIVTGSSAGSATLIIKSTSGKYLELLVTVLADDIPTLDLNETALSMDVNTSYMISAIATTDGTTLDTINSATALDTSVASVSIFENDINITALSVGTTTITVTSLSGVSEACTVTVNSVYADGEDVNNRLNDSNSTAFELTMDSNISDSIVNVDDWYEFNVTSYTDYNLTLKKLDGTDTVTASFYTDVASAPVTILSVANINGVESYQFTPSQESTYYVKVENSGSASVGYELVVSDLGIDYSLTTDGANFITREINSDSGNIHTFSGVYGEVYEVWILDSANSGAPYTVDVNISLYNAGANDIYFSNSDKNANEAEIVNPIKTETLYVKVIPSTAGQTGSYGIKVVGHTSYSDGMSTVPFPLTDSNTIPHSGKVGFGTIDKMSYYQTDATLMLEKQVELNPVSGSVDLLTVNFYEDSNCETVVESFEANTTFIPGIKHTYSKAGTFCLGITSQETSNTLFDIYINPISETTVTTYPALIINDRIPDDNGVSSLLSDINISFGLTSISKVTVDVNISHQDNGDLSIALVPPVSLGILDIVLSNHNGDNSQGYINTKFDDNGTDGNISAGFAPFTGSFIPDNLLSPLNGSSADGVWSLKITDVTQGSTGTLDGWSLTIE